MLMAGAPGFWGITIKPQKQFLIDLQYDEIVHLTQVSENKGFLSLSTWRRCLLRSSKKEKQNATIGKTFKAFEQRSEREARETFFFTLKFFLTFFSFLLKR